MFKAKTNHTSAANIREACLISINSLVDEILLLLASLKAGSYACVKANRKKASDSIMFSVKLLQIFILFNL